MNPDYQLHFQLENNWRWKRFSSRPIVTQQIAHSRKRSLVQGVSSTKYILNGAKSQGGDWDKSRNLETSALHCWLCNLEQVNLPLWPSVPSLSQWKDGSRLIFRMANRVWLWLAGGGCLECYVENDLEDKSGLRGEESCNWWIVSIWAGDLKMVLCLLEYLFVFPGQIAFQDLFQRFVQNSQV